MATKTIPLSRLETACKRHSMNVPDTGETIVVELPDLRPRENQCEAVLCRSFKPIRSSSAACCLRRPKAGESFATRRNEPRNGVHGADEKPRRNSLGKGLISHDHVSFGMSVNNHFAVERRLHTKRKSESDEIRESSNGRA